VSLWRQLADGVRALANRSAADRDVADQLQHYLDETTAAFVARGLSRDEARRAARLELGNLRVAQEDVRASGWENVVVSSLADLRQALRRLRRTPVFVAASALTLALGLGANAAVLSVINGVLLEPLPYPHAERLVALWHTAPGINIKDLNMAPSLYFTYADENRVFEDVALWTPRSPTVTGLAEPEELQALLVTHRFLSTLSVQTALGRDLTALDSTPGSARVVVVSDGYWRSRLGGDGAALGRRITIDGNAHDIIGVLPPSFRFMDRNVSLVLPLRLNRAEVRLVQFGYQGLARLRPGITLEAANADVARMLPLAPLKFQLNPGLNPRIFEDARIAPTLRLLKTDLVGDVGSTLWVLMGAVAIVLAIACANVASLLIVRADGRQHELAICAALGAGWARLARGSLLECVTLGTSGGLLGLALAHGALRIVTTNDLADLPRMNTVVVSPSVAAGTLGCSIAAGGLDPGSPGRRACLRRRRATGAPSRARYGPGRGVGRCDERSRSRMVRTIRCTPKATRRTIALFDQFAGRSSCLPVTSEHWALAWSPAASSRGARRCRWSWSPRIWPPNYGAIRPTRSASASGRH
jgi:putative ABC transport system permease protein